MRTYRKLLIPALVVGALFVPSTVAEAKVDVSVEGGQTSHYDTLSAAVAELGATKATITFTEDETGNVTIPVGAKYTINGGGHVLNGQITADASTAGAETHLLIDDLVIDGGGKVMGIKSQNQETEPTKLYLTVTNSTIRNTAGSGVKAIYITNAQQMTLDNVTFEDIISVDYVVDLNLVGVHDAEIEIKNSKFSSTNFDSAIKVAQRCLEGDEQTDIPACDAGITTSVKRLTVIDNNFDNVFSVNPMQGSAIKLGANSGGAASGQFVAQVTAGGTIPTKIEAANSGTEVISLNPGQSGIAVFDIDSTLSSDDKDFAIEVGKTFKPSYYLQTSAGRVELADVLNPEKLTFASDNDKVATVSDDGTVTATGEGVAKITATYGDQTYIWTVTVKSNMAVTDPETGGDETDTTEPVENVENPQTYDGSMMFIIAGVISALGLAGAGVGLGKESK